MRRAVRATVVLTTFVVVVLVGVGLLPGGVAGPDAVVGTPSAAAQEADRPPGEPCVPGASLPQPGAPPNGPSPVGRCEPSTRRRALDGAVWLATLAAVVGVAVLGVVLVRRDRRDRRDEQAGGSATSR